MVLGTELPSENDSGSCSLGHHHHPWRPEHCDALTFLMEGLSQTRGLCLPERERGSSDVLTALLCAGRDREAGECDVATTFSSQRARKRLAVGQETEALWGVKEGHHTLYL